MTTKESILSLLPGRPAEIASKLGIPPNIVQQRLSRLFKANEVTRNGGLYSHVTQQSVEFTTGTREEELIHLLTAFLAKPRHPGLRQFHKYTKSLIQPKVYA